MIMAHINGTIHTLRLVLTVVRELMLRSREYIQMSSFRTYIMETLQVVQRVYQEREITQVRISILRLSSILRSQLLSQRILTLILIHILRQRRMFIHTARHGCFTEEMIQELLKSGLDGSHQAAQLLLFTDSIQIHVQSIRDNN